MATRLITTAVRIRPPRDRRAVDERRGVGFRVGGLVAFGVAFVVGPGVGLEAPRALEARRLRDRVGWLTGFH
ncbi:MAG: hypothetical protein ACSLEW_04625 [Nocardioides sp.]